jgi:hypothetical protein
MEAPSRHLCCVDLDGMPLMTSHAIAPGYRLGPFILLHAVKDQNLCSAY